MKIFVKQLDGKILDIEVESSSSIEALKEELERLYSYPKKQQRIIFSGKPLDDSSTLEECLVKERTTIHLVVLPSITESKREVEVNKEEIEQQQKYHEQAIENVKEEEVHQEEQPQANAPANVLINGGRIRLLVDGKELAVVNREVVVAQNGIQATNFLIFMKYRKNVTLLGFQNDFTKEFLFSAPFGQSLFHGKYGRTQIHCRYPLFSFGEEFVLDEDGRLRHYRTNYYCQLKDDKLFITQKKEEASRFEFKKV